MTVFTSMPEKRQDHASEKDEKKENIFSSGSLYVLASIIFLYTACEFGIWNWFPKFLISTGIPTVKALNILSFGFASGLLVGRIVASKLLAKASPYYVTLTCCILMGVITFIMLKAPSFAGGAPLVFFAGFVMAPIFPTTIALVGRLFKQQAATAIGFAITCGFSGLVVSSPVIGWLSGSEAEGLGKGLLLLPGMSTIVVLILIVFRSRLTAAHS